MIKFAKIQTRKNQLNKELKRITRIIIQHYTPEKIFLFGSLAMDNIHPSSDIDLAIIKSTPERFIQRLHDVHLLTRPKVGVHFLVYTPKEFDQMVQEDRYFLTKEILSKGQVIYERK